MRKEQKPSYYVINVSELTSKQQLELLHDLWTFADKKLPAETTIKVYLGKQRKWKLKRKKK